MSKIKEDIYIRVKNESALFKKQARNVARKKGYTLSSYIRRLIREDLDKQSEDYKRDAPEDDGC